MKLLTTNFLTCAVKSCRSSTASYPLHFRDSTLESNPQPFNAVFIRNILPRLDWNALQTTAAELGLSALLPEGNPVDEVMTIEQDNAEGQADGMNQGGMDVDEETLKKLHTLLMETGVVEGKLVCGNCGFEYPVKEGVGNFLLPPHLV